MKGLVSEEACVYEGAKCQLRAGEPSEAGFLAPTPYSHFHVTRFLMVAEGAGELGL